MSKRTKQYKILEKELVKLNSRQLLAELVAISMRCAIADTSDKWSEIEDDKLYLLQKILIDRLEGNNGYDKT